jgi:hypothetical protein
MIIITGGADINAKDSKGDAPSHSLHLSIAASAGHTSVCEKLIIGGSNINRKDKEGENAFALEHFSRTSFNISNAH